MAKLEFLSKVQGLPGIINIKIKKIFEEKTDNYGKIKKCCVVDYNGTEYYVDFKSKDWNLLSEGAVLSAVKKLYDGKPYFEFYAGSTNAEAHKAYKEPGMTPEEKYGPIMQYAPQPNSEDIKNERIRWMNSINNACLLVAHGQYTEDIDRLGLIENIANQLYNLKPNA
jgi:hypothetical protein